MFCLPFPVVSNTDFLMNYLLLARFFIRPFPATALNSLLLDLVVVTISSYTLSSLILLELLRLCYTCVYYYLVVTYILKAIALGDFAIMALES